MLCITTRISKAGLPTGQSVQLPQNSKGPQKFQPYCVSTGCANLFAGLFVILHKSTISTELIRALRWVLFYYLILRPYLEEGPCVEI